jgi:hypothetical protein
MSNSILFMLIIGGIGIMLVMVATILNLVRRGPRRAGLTPSIVALALIAPTCAIILGEGPLRRGLHAMAELGEVSLVKDALLRSSELLLVGGAVALAILALFCLFLVPSLFTRLPDDGAKPHASPRRSIFLLLLALLPPLLTLPLWHYSCRTNTLHRVVMFSDGDSADKHGIEEEFEVLKLSGTAGIVAVSRALTRASMVKRFGGLFVAALLTAVAIIGTLVSWPAWFSRRFAIVALLLTLLIGAMTAVGMARSGLEIRALRQVSIAAIS